MQHRDELSGEMLEQLDDIFRELLAEMDAGSLPLTADMMAALQEMDLSQVQQLSPEQLQELAEQLSGQCDAMGQCMIAGGMPGDEPGGGEMGEGEMGEGEGDAEGTLALLMRMQGAGSGQPGEDGTGSPMRLGDRHPDAEGRERLALSNPDLSRAALGDLVGLEQGEHEVETLNLTGPAGAVAGPGGEGEAVWRDEVLPDEAEILQNYFR